MTRRWIVSARYAPDIPVDRARLRTTLMYRFSERFRLGVEVNPRGDDVGPIANWLVLDETETRPALILGTSSARVGTEDGRAVYATLSKDLGPWLDLPLAPYAGLSFDGADHRFREIYGLNVRYTPRVTTTHFYDGVNLHHQISYATDTGHHLGLLLFDLDGEHYLGANYGFSFGEGWELPSW